jgi:hypothetical protein
MLNPTRIRRSVTSAFLAIVSAALAVVARPVPVHAQHALASASAPIQPSNHWLDGLRAKHKQFFDNQSPNGGIALGQVFEHHET